jgi:plasmid stability protein
MAVLTIRDVPDEVRVTLAEEASARGQSLQAFLLGVLTQRADFVYNRGMLGEVAVDLAGHGGLDDDAPAAGEVIRAARRESRRG